MWSSIVPILAAIVKPVLELFTKLGMGYFLLRQGALNQRVKNDAKIRKIENKIKGVKPRSKSATVDKLRNGKF